MDRYNSASGADLRASVNGMWDTEAPNGTEFPYITFDVITTGLEQDFCSDINYPNIQFSIFGDANNKSALEVLQVGDLLLSLYKDVLLNPMTDGWSMIRSNVVNQRKIKDPDKGWQLIYEFEFVVDKVR